MTNAEDTIRTRECCRLVAERASAIGLIVYRSCSPKYANQEDLVSGEGSRLMGGRWNRKGVRAVYGSLSLETAMEEALSHFRFYGFPVHRALPRTFVAFRASIREVVDLREKGILGVLGLSAECLVRDDWRKAAKGMDGPSICQTLGEGLFGEGLGGIIVPSAADSGGANLVVFPDNLGCSDRLEILNPGELGDKRRVQE